MSSSSNPPVDTGRWALPPRQPSRQMAGWALGVAIAGLVCWGTIGLVGVGLGIAVLAKARDGRDHGTRMAFTAVIIGWLGTAWLLLVVVTVVLPLGIGGHLDSLVATDQVQADVTIVDPADIRAGDCVTDPAIDHPKRDSVLRIVPCAQPHDGRAFASLELRGDAYPGRKAVRRRASARCEADAVAAGDPAPDDYWIWYPTAESWREGDRHVLCVRAEGAEVGGNGSARA